MDSDNNIFSTDKRILEKYSSAFTLSDMEIFIFPDLFYPLIMANIMSPILWSWKDDPWFNNIEKKSFTYKSNRIKQFIIQNYIFNLDLSTWGLTSKSAEIKRFSDFFDMNLLKQSNALFGYEGDKYYFDIDIRKHFGLDKYDSDIIPYWKTETIEAMTAFRYKENFTSGAGECVSLSALYAAAMFVVGKVPLDNIYLIATPLHSQNFIIDREGLITNNRRIVTKNMWYNGTSLSEKARRAMENEHVTVVSHISGYIHSMYEEATIGKEKYSFFSSKLREFLKAEFTNLIFINFLRFKSKYKSLFQYRCESSGKQRYISLEKMFEYEHSSRFKVSLETRSSLIKEIEGDEFHLSPIQGKLLLNDIEIIIDSFTGRQINEIEGEFIKLSEDSNGDTIREMFKDLRNFISIDPKLPDHEKIYLNSNDLKFSVSESREKIIDRIISQAERSELARLTLYVYRQMDKISWLPFIKSAIERNPVCFTDLDGKDPSQLREVLDSFSDESIYEGSRLAMPDEVWNFRRGDGVEKAILLADFLHFKNNRSDIRIDISDKKVQVNCGADTYHFKSSKGFTKSIHIKGNSYSIT